MGHPTDEQRAIAHESKRVRSALDDLADLAGGNRRRRDAVPPPRSAPIPGLVPESFPVPPPAAFESITFDSRSDYPAPAPAPAPEPNDWFGDDDELAFTGPPSSGEVDFNSAPDEAHDTLGLRAGHTQEIPAGLAGPSAPPPAPRSAGVRPEVEQTPTSEAINDVLDGFEW